MKPPKSWLADYAQTHSKRPGDKSSTSKAKVSFGTNMDNTFRHYMAKKIHLQRDQFGLELPPLPSSSPLSSSPNNETDADKNTKHGNEDIITIIDANSNIKEKNDVLDSNRHVEKEAKATQNQIKQHSSTENDIRRTKGEKSKEMGKKRPDPYSKANCDEWKDEEKEDEGKDDDDAPTTMAGLLGRLRQKQQRDKRRWRSGSAAQLAAKRERHERRKRRRLRREHEREKKEGHGGKEEHGPELESKLGNDELNLLLDDSQSRPHSNVLVSLAHDDQELVHTHTCSDELKLEDDLNQDTRSKLDKCQDDHIGDDHVDEDVDGILSSELINGQHPYNHAPLTQICLSQEVESNYGDDSEERDYEEFGGLKEKINKQPYVRRRLNLKFSQEIESNDNDNEDVNHESEMVNKDMNMGRQYERSVKNDHAPLTKMSLTRDTYGDSENHDHNMQSMASVPESKTDTINSTTSTKDQSQVSLTLTSSPTKANSVDMMRQLKRERKDLFFLGVTVLVNGYTDPCADTIMRTLHRYGGNLEKYETSAVTHIIAETLSTAKAKIYKRQKRPIPVVKPAWIVDCVREGRLLSHAEYLLDEVKDDNHGPSVKDYFQKKEKGVGDARLKTSPGPETETETELSNGKEEELQMRVSKSITSTCGMGAEQPMLNTADPDEAIFLNSRRVNSELDSRPQQSTCVNADVPINLTTTFETIKNVANPTQYNDISSKNHKFQGKHRTVGTDPDFLEAYFSSSRLSFIGSFKQRIEHKGTNRSESTHLERRRHDDAKRFVFHVDMDCFFAAIALRKFPQFRDKPVAVGHTWRNDPNGIFANATNPDTKSSYGKESNSELSTCNYKARSFGVRKGMFLSRAKKLCPELVVLPYDYDGYEDAATKTGEILQGYVSEYNGALEQKSCDESYLELYLHQNSGGRSSDSEIDLAKSIGEKIRKDIYAKIECTVSVGIGENKMLAKLATNQVKDHGGNGVFVVTGEEKTLLNKLALKDLEGIGYRSNQKLLSNNLTYVQDVLDMSNGKEELCRILGPGNGSKIYNYCHGIDDRAVENPERKTIGAECNYGVRFDGPYGVADMMEGLAKEVKKRMKSVGVLGRHITVKVKERQPGAGPPGKFNGHGKCNDHSKSSTLPVRYATRDINVIKREGLKLFNEIGVKKDEVRGMGIIISKLEVDKPQEGGQLSSWFNVNPTSSVVSGSTPYCDSGKEISTQKESEIQSSIACKGVKRVTWQHESVNKNPAHHTQEQQVDNSIKAHKEQASPTFRELKEAPPQAIQQSTGVTNKRISDAKKSKSKTHKVYQPPTTTAKSDGRYKQYDVKSMLKLASIKSGEDQLRLDGQDVSLSQLGSLPLDIQLQVANEEGEGIAYQSYQNIHSKPISNVRSEEIIELDDTSVLSIEESVNAEFDDETQHLNQKDDILVLRQWMDEHVQPSPDHVEMVEDFLCVCVSEKRLDDVVSMLRIIKMRADPWGADHYKALLKKAENAIKTYEGRTLDLEWLGLLP